MLSSLDIVQSQIDVLVANAGTYGPTDATGADEARAWLERERVANHLGDLGYLGNEQEVVDDRNSRREITAAYYRRNSNRIRALRTMAAAG